MRDREAGMALLLVIFGLIVLSALALGMILVSQAGARSARADLLASEARATADAILLQTAEDLLESDDPGRPRVDGAPLTLPVLDQPVTLSITCELGKIDLNSADAATLERLLEAAGAGPAAANAEAGQIIAWRNGDGHLADSHPFRVLGELMQVPGMTLGLYQALWPAITIYSGRAQIDPELAPALALQAHGMSPLQAAASGLGGGSPGELVGGQLAPALSITGWAFRIEAGFYVEGHDRRLDAVIRMTGDPQTPYLVLDETLSPV